MRRLDIVAVTALLMSGRACSNQAESPCLASASQSLDSGSRSDCADGLLGIHTDGGRSVMTGYRGLPA